MELNKIYNEDCLKGMNRIPDKSIDMILCDLPYGTTSCKWDSIIPFEPLWEQYKRIIKDNGAIVLFAAQPFTTMLIHSNIKQYRYNWYWKKNNITGSTFAKVQPMRCIEDICVFYKQKPTYNPQGLIKLDKPIVNYTKDHPSHTYEWRGGPSKSIQEYTNYPNHLLCFSGVATSRKSGRLHPTQKPVPLLEYLVKTYTNEGEIVLDNCIGSGSTALACINTNRQYIGFETDINHYNTALSRVKQAI